jgi:hypothetical protein
MKGIGDTFFNEKKYNESIGIYIKCLSINQYYFNPQLGIAQALYLSEDLACI